MFLMEYQTFILLTDMLAISDLDRLARASRTMHELLISDRKESKGVWAQVAARMTAFPERQFHKDRILAALNETPVNLVDATANPPPEGARLRLAVNSDFFKALRCLMCPWTSSPAYVDVPHWYQKPMAMARHDETGRLVIQTVDGVQADAHIGLAFPSATKIAGFHTISMVFKENNDPKQFVDMAQHKDMCHEEDARRLLGGVMPIRDCSALGNSTYSLYVVSGAVVAITEVFRHDHGFFEEVANGLYFVSVHDRRVLARSTIPRIMLAKPFLMVSRPMELCYTAGDTMVYMYPRVLNNPLLEAHPSWPRARMYPALWMAADGDAVGAARYLEQISWRYPTATPSIDMRAANDRSTILQYAARFGHAEACETLLDMKANPGLRNHHGYDALCLALSGLHVDAAEAILSRSGKDSLELEVCHSAFRALSNPRERATPLDPEEIQAQCFDIIPRATRALLFNMGELFNEELPLFKTFLYEALRAPAILASPDAVRLILDTGGEAFVGSLKRNLWVKTIFQVGLD